MNEKTELEIIKRWYDGYKFGGEHVFNQFSVTNYLNEKLTNPNFLPQSFWVQSGSTKLIEDIVLNFKEQEDYNNFFSTMKELLLGKDITFSVSNQLTFRKILMKSMTIHELWTLYFHAGYLTISEYDPKSNKTYFKIPNLEIKYALLDHMNVILYLNTEKNLPEIAHKFLKNDLENSMKEIERYLTRFNQRSISKFFWRGGEGGYHLLFLMLLMNEKGISVTSENDSGGGYYDIAVVPDPQSDYKNGGFNI